MKINQISLINYRNHKILNLEFSPDSTLILGENGTGKTNILEAINFLATGSGFKSEFDREVITATEISTTVTGQITRLNQDTGQGEKEIKIGILIQKIGNEGNKSLKTAKINGKSTKIGNLSNNFNTVLFSPLEMNLLVNGPSKRRDFLDNLLSQSNDEYKKELSKYTKVRKQRNKVLETIREIGSGFAQLKFWDEKLIEYGTSLQKKRAEFLNYANKNINSIGQKIDPQLETKIKYLKVDLSEEILKQYQAREIITATSLVGPHRDDFVFTSLEYGENQDFSKFASRGQQRTMILSLKMCELEFLREKLGEDPVLLLDDIFSELDINHQEALKKIIGGQQTILTSTHPRNSFKWSKIIQLPLLR